MQRSHTYVPEMDVQQLLSQTSSSTPMLVDSEPDNGISGQPERVSVGVDSHASAEGSREMHSGNAEGDVSPMQDVSSGGASATGSVDHVTAEGAGSVGHVAAGGASVSNEDTPISVGVGTEDEIPMPQPQGGGHHMTSILKKRQDFRSLISLSAHSSQIIILFVSDDTVVIVVLRLT
ncbi:hypothetical protein V6N11_038958 [Hibiscus sabdariffa]